MSHPDLRMITVCVEYADLLSLTLPYNKHHFKDILVVTSWKDKQTQQLCLELGVRVFETDLFYRDGARFNKWLALETALDFYGREGWIYLMDADVLWPQDLKGALDKITPGFLYTPRRRMFPTIPRNALEIPNEHIWNHYPLHRNDGEFAGYSQIFHASDPALGSAPWHELDWKHAGACDSWFQQKWKPQNKIRPNFEVLHLGEAGVNWMGRSTPFADGTLPEGANERRREQMEMFRRRRVAPSNRRFDGEKIQPKNG